MPRRSRRRSVLDRRIKDLRKELALVKGDVRSLAKSLQDPDGMSSMPRLRSDGFRSARRTAPAKKAPPESSRETAAAQAERTRAPEKEEDLFSLAAKSPPVQEQAVATRETESLDREQAEELPPRTSRYWEESKLDSRDERFATYLMSGGLKTMGLMRQERRVQRNKAIFMVVVVLLLAIIVWNLFVK